jgi:flavin-dependent dehydrogenase
LESCDALVIGGGPAGSSTAWALRRAGADVLVLDRMRFPRDKLCAGWVTPQAVAALELDLADYAATRTLQPVRGLRASLIGEPQVETRFDEVVSYGVRRCEFDYYLLVRSRARVRTGALERLERTDGGWLVNGAIRTPLVVGAGGHFCPVARALGAGSGERPVVAAQEVELPLSEGEQRRSPVRPDVPELFFCRDLEGYGWLFRKGTYLNVGFGRRDPRAFPAQMSGFRRFLRDSGRAPESLPERWPGHSYLVYEGEGRKIVDDGVLLVGDAAGLAYAASGEGIGPAIESGLLAARVVLGAAGGYRREALAPYRAALEGRFGRRRKHDALRLVPAPVRSWLGARVLASSGLNKRLVVERLFLHRNLPPLAAAPPRSFESTDRRPSAARAVL